MSSGVGCASSTPQSSGDPPAPTAALLAAASGKGPAHAHPFRDPDLALPAGEGWRFVAPEDVKTIYDASYFDGRWFVLHGEIQSSEKTMNVQSNSLSWTRDGLSWQTIDLLALHSADSYKKLASNGHSLLLASGRQVSSLIGDEVVPIDGLATGYYAPVMLPYPNGYAFARFHDVTWFGNDGTREVVYQQQSLQVWAGVAREPGGRSLASGHFGILASTDGMHWSLLPDPPCQSCFEFMAYGNDRYLGGDSVELLRSSTGDAWEQLAQDAGPPGPVDFTGGYFVTLVGVAGTTYLSVQLSLDAQHWSAPSPVLSTGPAECHDRCYVANGRLLLPPAEP